MKRLIVSFLFIINLGFSQANYSLSFDGVDDYVNVGNDSDFDIDNTMTIEAWIKPTSLSNRHGIFTTRRDNDPGSFQLEVGTSDLGSNYVAVSGISSWVAGTGNNAISTGEWTHIAYTRNGTGDNHAIYVNGIAQTISTNSYTFVNNDALKEIGRGTSQGQHYNGQIDGLSIWDVVLTQEQIQSHISTPPTGNESGLVGYWDFNEGTGTTLADQTSNGNDGTIYGATWSTDVPTADTSSTTPPTISVDPDSIYQYLIPGESATQQLTINNTGNDTLYYSIENFPGCGDYLINGLPYIDINTNVGMADDWDVTYSDGPDVAYTLILTNETTIDVTLCNAGTDYDTKLEIFTFDGYYCNNTYTGAVSTGNYNDDLPCTFNNLHSSLNDVTLAEGLYYIVVDGYNGATGNYVITVTESVSNGRQFPLGTDAIENELNKMRMYSINDTPIPLFLGF